MPDGKAVEVVKAAKKLVDLIGADFIVSVGRGISKDVEGGIKLAEELAEVLGGVVGSSRACVDAGWITADHQVGQTGKTVHPKVYIALGISGAIQHKAGMQDSECIIAVNKNESAPIFEVADYGIVGDRRDVLEDLAQSFPQKPLIGILLDLEHIGDRQHIIMLGKALAQSLAEHHVLGHCHIDSSQPFLFGSM